MLWWFLTRWEWPWHFLLRLGYNIDRRPEFREVPCPGGHAYCRSVHRELVRIQTRVYRA